MNDIVFDVEGFPPAKNEALSMLGATHSHAPRVRALLEAARRAVEAQDFARLSGPVGLEVVLYAPASQDPWDATNYLGGIADTLESKVRRGPLEHLGDLRGIALYQNDRQIREVHYRQEMGTVVRYPVRVRSLEI